jgi:hypothetical protein
VINKICCLIRVIRVIRDSPLIRVLPLIRVFPLIRVCQHLPASDLGVHSVEQS